MTRLREVRVAPYDPAWVNVYRVESRAIAAVFGDLLLSIHHIGSTSVPGLAAKPIVDIMPVVRDIELVDRLNPQMAALGYTARGENEIAGRRLFIKGDHPYRTHNVHVYAPGNPEIARHLDFRDYLRTHPAAAREYGRLKQCLAEQHRFDIDAYLKGKSAFIQETIAKAQSWREET